MSTPDLFSLVGYINSQLIKGTKEEEFNNEESLKEMGYDIDTLVTLGLLNVHTDGMVSLTDEGQDIIFKRNTQTNNCAESNSIFEDIRNMYLKYDLIKGDEKPHIPELIDQRIAHLEEELAETIEAVKNNDLEEMVDGLIDLIVIAAGTLEMAGVDSQAHWNEVLRANMSKERGVNPKRGFAVDIIKPEGWKGPDHQPIINRKLSK